MHPSLYSPCLNPWYHNPPTTLAFFPIMQDHQDYPSPAPSDPSHSGQQLDQYQNQDSFDKIDSNIGPSRVSRRQASLKQGLLVRRVSLSTNYSRPDDTSVCLCVTLVYSVVLTDASRFDHRMPQGRALTLPPLATLHTCPLANHHTTQIHHPPWLLLILLLIIS